MIRFPLRAQAAAVCCILLAGFTSPAFADREQQRSQYRRALEAVAKEPGDAWKRHAIDLDDYPLLAYVERAVLERGKSPPALVDVEAFLARWPESFLPTKTWDVVKKKIARSQEAWKE